LRFVLLGEEICVCPCGPGSPTSTVAGGPGLVPGAVADRIQGGGSQPGEDRIIFYFNKKTNYSQNITIVGSLASPKL